MAECYACGKFSSHTTPTAHTHHVRVCEPCAKAQRIATESFEADELTPIHDHGLNSNSERGEGSPQETAPAKSPLPTRSPNICMCGRVQLSDPSDLHLDHMGVIHNSRTYCQ